MAAMKTLILATLQSDPLRLYTGRARLVGVEHLPGIVAATIDAEPRAHLLAWSAAETGCAGFSQHGLSLVLPFPVMSAGIGSMQRAKASGFVTLFVRTAEAGVVDVLGSDAFQQMALDRLLAQQAALGELLGCTLSVEDWGYDC